MHDQEDFERAIGILEKFKNDAEWMSSLFKQLTQDHNDESDEDSEDSGEKKADKMSIMKAFVKSRKSKDD